MIQQEFLTFKDMNCLQDIINNHHADKILLITGKDSFTQSGAADALLPYLKNKAVIRFSTFAVNPQLKDAHIGINLIKESQPELIIAIGGGSVIDMGKLVNSLSAQKNNNTIQIIKNSTLIKNKGLPFIAIPTTAGTGSEATHFAVVYVDKIKYSLAHQYILPDYAIVFPALTYKLPSDIIASSGLDALSQAIESYWAVGSTLESKKYASEAISMLMPNIVTAACEHDKSAMNSMAIGANLAGKAINISKTTAAHAISYPITTHYNIPHGHAVALTLGKFFIINSQFNPETIQEPRGNEYLMQTMSELFKLLDCNDAQVCCKKWYELMARLGLKSELSQVGIASNSDQQTILDNINIERLENNPVKLDAKTLEFLFPEFV
ncbi:MAG: phosphonoacetaldehyde reductase [Methyloprofundus sp.]|nr:phosphonoacetaldehyde reductase [Methyloprofundus sp.]